MKNISSVKIGHKHMKNFLEYATKKMTYIPFENVAWTSLWIHAEVNKAIKNERAGKHRVKNKDLK